MSLDIGVLDDDFRYMRHLRIEKMVHGVLFKKLVTPAGYPSLGKAQDESEDITFSPLDIPALLKDVVKLEKHLKKDKLMSAEVKGKCLEFVSTLKEICEVARKEGRNVEFIAGE
jgi:hypothetical protein